MNGRKREATDVLPLHRSVKQPRTDEQLVLAESSQLRTRWYTLTREVISLASDTFQYITGASDLPLPTPSRPRAQSLPTRSNQIPNAVPVASSSQTEMGPPPLPPRFPAPSDTHSDVEMHSATSVAGSPTSTQPSVASTPFSQTLQIDSTSIDGGPSRLKHRPHIFARTHRSKVDAEKQRQREEMTQELYDLRRAGGYQSSYADFQGYLKYRQTLENFEKSNVLSPSSSLESFRSRTTTPELNRRQLTSQGLLLEDVQPEFLQRAIKTAQDSLRGPKPIPPFSPSLDILSKKRWARDAEIEARLRPKRPPLPTSLPPADEAQVNAFLAKRGPISKFAREQVADKDLVRLRPSQWLNDEIINFYGAMLLARAEGAKENAGAATNGAGRAAPLNAYYFSTFFWQKLCTDGYEKGRLAKWTKKVDIFSKDVVLVPVNHNNSHWTAAAINFRRKRIESYDSMGMPRQNVFKALRAYLDAEHKNKKKQPFDFTGWEDLVLEDTPQQENMYDCGVFTCQFLESLSRGEESFNFQQSDMPYLRRRMIWEIGNARLRDD